MGHPILTITRSSFRSIVGILIVTSFRDVVSCYCCLSSSIAAATLGVANVSWCYLRLVFKVTSLTGCLQASGTNIGRVLMFVGVLLFMKLIATALIGTYIYRVPYFFD